MLRLLGAAVAGGLCALAVAACGHAGATTAQSTSPVAGTTQTDVPTSTDQPAVAAGCPNDFPTRVFLTGPMANAYGTALDICAGATALNVANHSSEVVYRIGGNEPFHHSFGEPDSDAWLPKLVTLTVSPSCTGDVCDLPPGDTLTASANAGLRLTFAPAPALSFQAAADATVASYLSRRLEPRTYRRISQAETCVRDVSGETTTYDSQDELRQLIQTAPACTTLYRDVAQSHGEVSSEGEDVAVEDERHAVVRIGGQYLRGFKTDVLDALGGEALAHLHP